MKRLIYIILLGSLILCMARPALADVCKVRCRTDEGIICVERGPCEPINEFLLRAARNCRVWGPEKYVPITRLLFVDILSQVLRLDRELPQLDRLEDEDRYALETRLLKEKGIEIFIGTNAFDPLTREELATVLKDVTIEEDLKFSSGLPDQAFDLKNDELIIYNAEVYVDEGRGLEPWERKRTFEESSPDSRHYVIKLDSCNNARVVFGDDEKGKIPVVGSRLKAAYKIFGKEEEFVTECEVVLLLANRTLAGSLKDTHNPSRPLTRANFADLLIRTMRLERELPRDTAFLSTEELYLLETRILARNGITIFLDTDPGELLTREELARVLYDSPVETVIGVSNGKDNQGFELNNAGFIIYDLHTYVREGIRYEEWDKKNNFMESSSTDKDYLVKLDMGNYATIYFGDDKKGKIPAVNSPIKATYRLYAPIAMFTEDDVICVLKPRPVAETYIPPPPPPEYPEPTDGFDDPATHT